ncbi:unnamed protein product [Nippostrongylus brasiliensis]|uniref:ILEI domain-containing protein n=1 Tax=Nippostrongylus brasiliensis TaxID=27835 RepID=A0A0N4XM20_NIPBR|nr:unnamed protein product [Nippostrongylus brasiliensis]
MEAQVCRIPKLDINGAEVKDFFFKSKPLRCGYNPENWVYIDGNGNVQYIEKRCLFAFNRIKLTSLYNLFSRKNAQCSGRYVTRESDNTNTYTQFTSLPSGKPLDSDFAMVSCVDGRESWKGILMSVVRIESNELLSNGANLTKKDGAGLNVFFLGFDSLSQMSFRRKLPKTVQLLEGTLGSVVLNGYNIVGDGTPQAFIPILTAATEEELPLTRSVHDARFK